MSIITSLIYNKSAAGIGGAIGGLVNNATDGDVFPNVSVAAATTGFVKYRCIYLTAGAFTYTDLGMYIATPTPSEKTKVYIGIGVAAIGADEPSPSDEFTAPAGVVFLHPTNIGYMLNLPNLTTGQRIPIWIKLVVDALTPGADSDYCRLYVDGVEA